MGVKTAAGGRHGKEISVSSSAKRIGRTSRLVPAVVLAVAAIAVGGTQAAAKPGLTATAEMARHFQHEDALYGMKGAGIGARTPAQAMALHFKHEDALYGRKSQIASSPGSAQLMALHFRHEDALYGAQRSAVAQPTSSVASNRFDWSDALVGAAGAVGVIFLSGAAVVTAHRGRSRVAQS